MPSGVSVIGHHLSVSRRFRNGSGIKLGMRVRSKRISRYGQLRRVRVGLRVPRPARARAAVRRPARYRYAAQDPDVVAREILDAADALAALYAA